MIESDGKLSYVGYFKNNLPKGSGKFISEHGETCVVEEKDDKLDYARCYDTRGQLKYLGDWKAGKFNGIGKLKLDKNKVYEGEFSNGRVHGEGKIYDEHHDLLYQGKFINGKRQGNLNYYSEPIILSSILTISVLLRYFVK